MSTREHTHKVIQRQCLWEDLETLRCKLSSGDSMEFVGFRWPMKMFCWPHQASVSDRNCSNICIAVYESQVRDCSESTCGFCMNVRQFTLSCCRFVVPQTSLLNFFPGIWFEFSGKVRWCWWWLIKLQFRLEFNKLVFRSVILRRGVRLVLTCNEAC